MYSVKSAFAGTKGWTSLLVFCLCCLNALVAQEDIRLPIKDLRGHDWKENPTVSLDGTWGFTLTGKSATAAQNNASSHLIEVPGSWTEQGVSPTNHASGTYQLLVLLSPDHPRHLAVQMEEVLTAYELWINGERVGGAGKIGHDITSTQSEFAPDIFTVPQADTLRVEVRCSNFRHRQAGMASPPLLGEIDKIARANRNQTVAGGILIGLLLMSCAVQFMDYFLRRKDKATLYAGIASLILSFHYLFLHERIFYRLLGPDAWSLCYKLELASLLWFMLVGISFIYFFLEGVLPSRLRIASAWIIAIESCFILALPIQTAAQFDLFVPFQICICLIIVAWVMVKAMRRKVQGAVPMTIATVLVIMAAAAEKLLIGVHVGGLLSIQYFLAAYMIGFSWMLSRRAAAVEHKVFQLSQNLEASNRALEETNQSLEEQVRQRTEELVRVQLSAHELEMEQVRRDIETLSANNQMKMQLTRNLVEELQQLLSAGGDYQSALKSLISGLRGQMATEERLEVLQDDLDSVNAEFYRRLQAKYPQLSKTEREICAYLKLNLSGKDIAQLRKTSINTVNVARHRIRKKLGLERDEELEAVIQQL